MITFMLSFLHLYLLFAVRGALSLMSLAAACIRLFYVSCVGNEGTVCGFPSWCRVRHLSPRLPQIIVVPCGLILLSSLDSCGHDLAMPLVVHQREVDMRYPTSLHVSGQLQVAFIFSGVFSANFSHDMIRTNLFDFYSNNIDVPAALHWEKVRWPVGWVEATLALTCKWQV